MGGVLGGGMDSMGGCRDGWVAYECAVGRMEHGQVDESGEGGWVMGRRVRGPDRRAYLSGQASVGLGRAM